MRLSKLFPSKYLKATDVLPGKESHLIVDMVRIELMEQSGEEKPVMYFHEEDRGLVLNVTNGNTIAASYGEETDAWTGKPLVLYGTTTSFAGKQVPCIRVRVPAESSEGADAEPAEVAVGDTTPF